MSVVVVSEMVLVFCDGGVGGGAGVGVVAAVAVYGECGGWSGVGVVGNGFQHVCWMIEEWAMLLLLMMMVMRSHG